MVSVYNNMAFVIALIIVLQYKISQMSFYKWVTSENNQLLCNNRDRS